MALEQIQAIVAEPSLEPSLSRLAGATGNAPAGQFGNLVTAGIERVNDQLLGTQTDLQRVALGQGGSVHQVMIRMEEARLSFQLLMQVRNRVLEAYQDVMRMQL
ncbi:MAG: flagellar hook-basal body complex protein FliE [Massilia sp.]